MKKGMIVLIKLFVFAEVSFSELPLIAGELDYRYFDLGHLGPVHSRYTDVFDINDNGQIVGVSQIVSGVDRAIIWENGRMGDLAEVDSDYFFSVAAGIANDGTIVGSVNFFSEMVRYKDGELTVYPVPSPCTIGYIAEMISKNAKFAAGTCWDGDASESHGVFLDLNAVTSIIIDVPDDIPYTNSPETQAINNDGTIIGRIGIKGFEYWQGFTWRNAEMELISNTLGGEASPAYAMNNYEAIYGSTEYGAYRFASGEMTLLLDFDPDDVNDREQVVGHYIENFSSFHTVLFDDGQLIELNDQIPYGDTQNRLPSAINNYGWIIGWVDGPGDQQIAWLLVPIYPKGDFDGDDDVDLHDFGHFQRCFAAEAYQGPEGGLHVGCSVFDFDDDIDLDGDDFAAFQAAFTGAITSGW